MRITLIVDCKCNAIIYDDAIKITMNYVKMRVNDMLKDKLNGREVFSTGINKHIEIQTYTKMNM